MALLENRGAPRLRSCLGSSVGKWGGDEQNPDLGTAEW